MFCQHSGCSAVDASPGQAHKHQQTLEGRSGPVRAAPPLQMLTHKWEQGAPVAPSLSFPGSSRSRALGRGNAHRAVPGSISRAGSTQPWAHSPCSRLSAVAASPAHPEVSQPLHQQLLVHFPSSQAHFLSLVHRDYSNSNQKREERAPQNARGTKLYKG